MRGNHFPKTGEGGNAEYYVFVEDMVTVRVVWIKILPIHWLVGSLIEIIVWKLLKGAVKKLPMIRARPKAGLEVCFSQYQVRKPAGCNGYQGGFPV